MIKEIKRHPLAYGILICLNIVLLYFLIQAQNPRATFIIIIFLVLFYLAWSLLHHLYIKKLTPAIMLEYLLLAVLGLVVLKVVFFPFI